MLPGIGTGEYIVIAIVALVVVGPKDLPKLLRQLGRFVGKMRSMADDFRASFDEMARQSELDELRKEVEALRTQRSIPILDDVKNEVNAISSDIEDRFRGTPAPTFHAEVDDRGVLLEEPEEAPAPAKKPRVRKTVKAKSTIDVVALADTGEVTAAPVKLKPVKAPKPKPAKVAAKPAAKADKTAQPKRKVS
ncbi:MAG TPA: Sec-independent protein translocase protein TatB [Asticcacaulis sp.]|nr:Sec-independent protein translocase protein TatB [Asticcacaulis sp.]